MTKEEKIQASKKKWRESERGKELNRQGQKRWRESEKGKTYVLQRKYGISLVEYNKLLLLQNYRCKICNRELNLKNPHDIHVDHNCVTGNVRGILCQRCNMALGLFDDDIQKILNAARYVEDTK